MGFFIPSDYKMKINDEIKQLIKHYCYNNVHASNPCILS